MVKVLKLSALRPSSRTAPVAVVVTRRLRDGLTLRPVDRPGLGRRRRALADAARVR